MLALTTLALCVPATSAAFLVGQSVLSAEHLDTTLGRPWAGFGLLCLYAAVLLGLAAWQLRRRDA